MANKTSDQVIEALVSTINDLHSLNIIVEEFKTASQPVLNEKLNSYIEHLQKLDTLRTTYDSSIPVDILTHLDDPKVNNPEVYTKQTLEKCADQSQTIEKRVQALRMLKEELQQQFQSEEQT